MRLKSKLGIGTVQFGIPYGISNINGQTSSEEVSKILKLARIKGILLIDTASIYGISEEILGKNNLVGFQIVSKFMPPKNGEDLRGQLDKSLSKLNVSSLYGYLAHRPIEILKNPKQWKELGDLKNKGLVTKIGFSLNEPSELEKLLSYGFVPDIIQIPFNYFDRRFVPIIKKIKESGCEIHARSAFLQGLFFTNVDHLSVFFNDVKPIILNLQKTVKYLPAALLRFVAEQSFIDKVVVGVENVSQLLEDIEDIDFDISLPKLNISVSKNILMPAKWPK